MLAITTLLTPQYAARINRIIKGLETEFGLDDVQATPDPHITYQLAGVKKLSALKSVLSDVAATTVPFEVHTTGLGVFPGPNPVIYIPVLRTDELNRLHQRIIKATAPLCLRTDKFSGPDCWLPHISLALHDTTPELLGPVLQYLNQQTFNLKLMLDNLAILRQEGDLFLCEELFPFEGETLAPPRPEPADAAACPLPATLLTQPRE
ncbi:2'-5' RNA ligase family protein [Hymenobacter sp. BT635]|uniref:2'-5' RNA ligase family protein n=1 Tax=Hymenobacter nitidus TaxID=2880929 RepID=A0ABS8AC33_9BACT|nr:2'-5' RNA ligase family protein [Hymenobacter nitidus]MCB2377482.1 2'-5' RNA ligase family protein [Hymenobacter nitidus]